MGLEANNQSIVIVNEKPKRERLKVGDPDFEPPDGGWGWLIVFACGLSNLCSFPMFQQYGLVFKEKFKSVGISQSETITIVNLCVAFNTGIGLINGPVFRRFTQRQVALFCACLVVTSLIACSFCSTFLAYILFYSIGYGGGFGMLESANALAINTYFKEKRRIATGFSWTSTALGPIVCPYIVIYFNKVYGVEGTLLLFGGFAMHSFVCSLLLHPVEWHTKFRDEVVAADNNSEIPEMIKPSQDTGRLSRISSSLFSSQYFGNEAGYEITETGAPMVLRDKDGWYSQTRSRKNSKFSIHSNKDAEQKSGIASFIGSYNSLRDPMENIAEGAEPTKDKEINTPAQSNDQKLLKNAIKKLAKYETVQEKEQQKQLLNDTSNEVDVPERISFWKKIAHDFDFDLLSDPIFVNLMLGITLSNFAEMNFSMLTPLILAEFQFEQAQIATFMSLLAATDIIVRFSVSFVADKISVSSRYFYLIGVMTMLLGRVILIHTQTYYIGLFVAIVIGIGKALRTIFIMLVIPSYVSLERLPAAFGLQFASSGLVFTLFGPVAGWIREAVGNYVVTLHILQICTFLTAFCWITESLITIKKKNRKKLRQDGNARIKP